MPVHAARPAVPDSLTVDIREKRKRPPVATGSIRSQEPEYGSTFNDLTAGRLSYGDKEDGQGIGEMEESQPSKRRASYVHPDRASMLQGPVVAEYPETTQAVQAHGSKANLAVMPFNRLANTQPLAVIDTDHARMDSASSTQGKAINKTGYSSHAERLTPSRAAFIRSYRRAISVPSIRGQSNVKPERSDDSLQDWQHHDLIPVWQEERIVTPEASEDMMQDPQARLVRNAVDVEEVLIKIEASDSALSGRHLERALSVTSDRDVGFDQAESIPKYEPGEWADSDLQGPAEQAESKLQTLASTDTTIEPSEQGSLIVHNPRPNPFAIYDEDYQAQTSEVSALVDSENTIQAYQKPLSSDAIEIRMEGQSSIFH